MATKTTSLGSTADESAPGRGLVAVFGAWSFLASLLIFWVELMVAKMLLPRFGGSPAVWNTALVFFQVTLLAGYAGAHLLARLDSRRHQVIQIALVSLPLLTLPVALPSVVDSGGLAPTVAVLVALTAMVGAPFFALSTSTPTLQAWFSHSAHHRSADPYFLYALGNLGSVVGLLGYPLVIERFLTIETQTVAWSLGYGLFVVLTIAGARLVGGWEPAARVRVEPVPMRRRLRWAGLAFVPALALLAVTRHLSTDVAAFPLMWTVPLALYLSSFVLTFRSGGAWWTARAAKAVRLLVVPAALVAGVSLRALWLDVALPLGLLFALAVAAHGRVYEDRPDASRLTSFYLWVSIGGAAGGMVASLAAPAIFDFVAEYPIALVLAALFAGSRLRAAMPPPPVAYGAMLIPTVLALTTPALQLRILLLAVVGALAVMWLDRRRLAVVVAVILGVVALSGDSTVLASERTFFGVYEVHEDADGRFLRSGTTSHGRQVFEDGSPSLEPVSYYHPAGPAGDVLGAHDFDDVGVIGLGVGSLASYGGADDRYTFYEIDPVVEDIATDERYFTLLSDATASVEVVIGDGRLELERRAPTHDLVVVDAFTSDAIPVHLLTVEAFETYFDSVEPGGAILVNISNRYLALEPVIGRIAEELGVSARVRRVLPGADDRYADPTTWMVLERRPSLELDDEWKPAEVGEVLWTDDYSNVVSVIEWG